jgi:predicted nucleic acid-binding protein
MLIDSDVLVWLTRGHAGAAARLQAITPWQISVVTYIELAQGCRNKAELERLKNGFAQQPTNILPITKAESELAMKLIDRHALSDGLKLADALIAATALELGVPLLTGNIKHFGAVAGLSLDRFDPTAAAP